MIIHHTEQMNKTKNMETIFKFIKSNFIGFSIAITVFFIYLYFNYNGNRICDCKTTEKYNNSTTSGSRGNGVHHFYHK